MTPFTQQHNVSRVVKLLEREYPVRGTALEFHDAWQLLTATILSAQCTDATVNKVTPLLFAAYPSPCALGHANILEVERIVKPTGFYHNKARAIIAESRELCEKWNSTVVPDMDFLTALPGVGRKTANVVLAHAFGKQAVVVDTHVKRLAYRIGFSSSLDPTRIESDIMQLVKESEWNALCDALIAHGRTVCSARRPACATCFLASLCPRNGVASPVSGRKQDQA
ncbi:MAG TPA: endonuclease III [Candidatus Cryosericum sp.]|nr:endonuclease III [Candidatus Cryosericum sp.]